MLKFNHVINIFVSNNDKGETSLTQEQIIRVRKNTKGNEKRII